MAPLLHILIVVRPDLHVSASLAVWQHCPQHFYLFCRAKLDPGAQHRRLRVKPWAEWPMINQQPRSKVLAKGHDVHNMQHYPPIPLSRTGDERLSHS
jgi:hypothetical protein